VHEEKDRLDWRIRLARLREIVEGYRNQSGNNYDCVVPVSGGRDSYFTVHTVVKTLGLNPLLVNYNHEFNTKIGIRNLANLYTVFDCDAVQYTVDPTLLRQITRHTLMQYGNMYWHVLAGNQTFPVQVAARFKIPLVIWGVHGWIDQVGMFSHLDEVEMAKKNRKEHALFGVDVEELAADSGLPRSELARFEYPSDKEIESVGIRGIYLNNFIHWDAKKQHEDMIRLYGYETAVQQRTYNTYEDVECFHLAGTHDYVKFLKHGYGKVSDHASRDIRLKRLTREKGIEQVRRYQNVVPDDLGLFLKWAGMTEGAFYDAVARFRSGRVWTKRNGEWELTESVLHHIDDDGVDAVRLEKRDENHYIVTPQKEPASEDREYVLMGRGYIDKTNFQAISDDQDPNYVKKELEAYIESNHRKLR
jgi:N-acetyl sugar amidotransferase